MPENKPYILYFITKANFGGAQRYVYDLATTIPETYRTSVVFGEDGALKERLEAHGVRTIHLPSLSNDMNPFMSAYMLVKLFLLLRKERPDVFHINSSKAGVFGAFAARLAGVPRIIFTVHGWAFNEDRPWWQKMIIKLAQWFALFFAHKVILVSHALKNQINNWPLVQHKLTVIHNGIDTDSELLSREEAREKLSVAPDAFVVGTIAELHPVKGLSYAIEAIAELRASYPNVQYVVLGEGKAREQLEKSVRKHRLKDIVLLKGFVDNAAQHVRAFDIFLLPSVSEGLGYVLLEAGCARIPVVASGVGGVLEIIEHEKNGLLVESRSPSMISTTLSRLAQDETLFNRLATQLHEDVTTNFSQKVMLEATYSLY